MRWLVVGGWCLVAPRYASSSALGHGKGVSLVQLQLLHLPLSPGQHRGGALLLPSVKLVGRMLGLPGNVRGHANH